MNVSPVPAIPPTNAVTGPLAPRAAEPRLQPDPTLSPIPTQTVKPGRPTPNPTLRLDARLGMVVLEFHDDQGAVSGSIPSQRVLDAYRNHSAPIPQQQIPVASSAKDADTDRKHP